MVIRHGEVGAGKFALSLLQHVNILGDALGISIVAKHVCQDADKFAWVEVTTVGIKVVKQLFCGDMGVEGLGVVEVLVQEFLYAIADELGGSLFRGLVRGQSLRGGWHVWICGGHGQQQRHHWT